MTVREYCVMAELEWWASYYGVVFDMDVSDPNEISILAVRIPQTTFTERSIEPQFFMQGRSGNALKRVFYLNAYTMLEWILTYGTFTSNKA